MANVLKVLDKAERVEALAAQLYAAMATRFDVESKGRSLFERLAREEQQHALRVRMLASQVRKRNVVEIEEPADLDGMIPYLENLILSVGKSDGMADLERAIGFCVALENKLAGVHASKLCRAHPDLFEVFEALARADREHCSLLQSIAKPKQD